MPLLTTDSNGLPLLPISTTLTLTSAGGPLSADGGAEDWELAGTGAAAEAGVVDSGAAGLAEGAATDGVAGADRSGVAGLAEGVVVTGAAEGVGPGTMSE